ncbi:hypothetical protein X975_18092, partial [Stegodyphus mimosarum]
MFENSIVVAFSIERSFWTFGVMCSTLVLWIKFFD